jgi:SAM-dependent methyltransferase
LIGSLRVIKRAAGSAIRDIIHPSYDLLDRLRRAADALVPPRGINPNVGFTPRRGAYRDQFIASGERIADMLVSYADLQPMQSVLDIGCGIGRVARPLTARLSSAGRYRGFDVDPRAIEWCQRAYRSFENFSFAHAPVGYVNVKDNAPLRGEDFAFPYPDSDFDLAFSVSLYTHLGRSITDHYLSETCRVLRPGGYCVNTFFVVDQFALEAMRARQADRSYIDHGDGSYLASQGDPNFGIGFAPEVISALHEANGLTIVSPVRFGSWTGREVESFVYQDVIVARR